MFSYHLARCVALNSALECEQKMLCNHELNRSFSPALLPTVFRVLFDCTSKWLGELTVRKISYMYSYIFIFFLYVSCIHDNDIRYTKIYDSCIHDYSPSRIIKGSSQSSDIAIELKSQPYSIISDAVYHRRWCLFNLNFS